jgi:hypothetical protein
MVNIRDRLNQDRLVDDLNQIGCESCDPKGQFFGRKVRLKGVEKSYLSVFSSESEIELREKCVKSERITVKNSNGK